MKVIDKKQQKLLDEFFQRERLLGLDYYGFGIAAGIVLAIAALLSVVPYQVWEGNRMMMGHVSLLEVTGMEMYMMQYRDLREDGRNRRVYEILCYLPVSYGQFVLYILRKLLRLGLCLAGISAACQVVFAWAFLDTVAAGNLLMPFLGCLVLPVALVGGTLLWSRR